MRRFLAFLLVAAAAVTLAACGGSGSLAVAGLTPSPHTSSPVLGASETAGVTSSAPTDSLGAGRTASPAGDFSVVLPRGWQEDRAAAQTAGALDAYRGADQGGFRTNVNVVREQVSTGVDLDAYRLQALAGLKRALPVSNITAPTTTRVDGEDARQYSFSDAEAGFRLRQRQTVVLHGGYGYVITYTATQSAFDSAATAAASIVTSLRWA